MPPTNQRRFAIAFSFPGERREYVEKVARALLPAFGGESEGKARVFYDAWHEEPIIGYNTSRKLQRIYAHDVDLVVPLYCQEYLNKEWCGVELRAIEELLFEQQYDRVLPFRFGMVEIPGSFKSDVFPIVTNRPPEEIAKLILERFNRLHQSTLSLPERPPTPQPRFGNLRPATPVFVGRTVELKQLEDAVLAPLPRRIVVVHGLGGMGKTELAVKFGDLHAARFPAGLWVLGAEGKTELLPLLGDLALALGLPASAGPDESPAQRGRRVLRELDRRARESSGVDPDGGACCLLLLDNVSVRALLAEPQRAELAGTDWLQVLATTRLAPTDLRGARGQGMIFVSVDTLEPEAALDLMRQHQPDGQWPAATAEADAAAARDIVQELGSFTLTVEAVALYLGLHPEIRPTAYLARLRKEGLPSADTLGTDPDIAVQTRHREKQLALVLEAMLQQLAPAERTALDYAALLPPDCIPWPWLRVLVAQDHPDMLSHEEGYPEPWVGIRTRLESLRLLTPANHSELARLHRMVAACVREQTIRRTPEMLRRVHEVVSRMASQLEYSIDHHTGDLWMLRPLEESIRLLDSGEPVESLALASDVVGGVEMTIGRFDTAFDFLCRAEKSRRILHERDQGDSYAARSLSITLNKVGDFLARRGLPGDAEKALGHYQRSLEISERLLMANPESAQAARDVSVSHWKLHQLHRQRGNQPEAGKSIAACFAILDSFARLGRPMDPQMRGLYEQLKPQFAGNPK